MPRMFFKDEPCQPHNFRCNRVCPRIVKAEFGRCFFSGNFRRRFNGRAKWITNTHTLRLIHPANPTHTGIATRNWFTVTRITRTFTIGTAIERRSLPRLVVQVGNSEIELTQLD